MTSKIIFLALISFFLTSCATKPVAIEQKPKIPYTYESVSEHDSMKAPTGKRIPNPQSRRDFIVIKQSGEEIKKIPCLSGAGYDERCYAVPLKSREFVLVDCMGHDSVAMDCSVQKYTGKGSPVPSFNSPFATTSDQLTGNYVHKIKTIQKVFEDAAGNIIVHGTFMSPLIPNIPDQTELGDDVGALGYVALSPTGQFLWFREK